MCSALPLRWKKPPVMPKFVELTAALELAWLYDEDPVYWIRSMYGSDPLFKGMPFNG